MKIFWTKKALRQHEELEKYLLDNFSKISLNRYCEKLANKIILLKRFPETGVVIRGRLRKMNITSQTALVYKIIDQRLLVIMMVWDNRKKPIW